MRIKKGDEVKILLGKDSGKEGKVEYVMAKEKRVFVGGANIYKRHVRKMQGVEGGIINIPKSMDISNVALICPNCKKVTRVGYKILGKEKMRVCKKCKKEITHPSKGGKT
ncbi:MAG: large subunit ribosomal protein L24 [Microgenomates group bacterium Gr01-1014_7]|nr:MAG: large subunit ribosomal protein L24 [Microgenomates group bacterium Gr01-1014_7]